MSYLTGLLEEAPLIDPDDLSIKSSTATLLLAILQQMKENNELIRDWIDTQS